MPWWLPADWPAPAHVRAGTTLRHPGDSRGPYSSFNLGSHVGDDPALVAKNRDALREGLALPADPCWLQQVHGTEVVGLSPDGESRVITADGSFTRHSAVVCAVLTADCLPVLLSDRQGREVAAVHAGWRGLQAGVLQQAVAKMSAPPNDLLAWFGPAISQAHFEVGEEVRRGFIDQLPENDAAFIPGRAGRWMADLYGLAKNVLHSIGVDAVYGGVRCTYAEPEDFFSFRRENLCGRQASLIWLQD